MIAGGQCGWDAVEGGGSGGGYDTHLQIVI